MRKKQNERQASGHNTAALRKQRRKLMRAPKFLRFSERRHHAIYLCDCGKQFETYKYNIMYGHTRSCGCAVFSDRTKMKEYKLWQNMRARCNTQSATGYHRYGGRGIKVCERWLTSFDVFLGDVGLAPTSKHSLDRIDNDGIYEPGNVRWATQKEQCRNTRRNRFVMIDGKKTLLADAAKTVGLKPNTVIYRLRRGWPIEAALEPRLQPGVKFQEKEKI